MLKHRTTRIRTLSLAAATLAAALSLTACNGSDEAADTTSPTASTTTSATTAPSASSTDSASTSGGGSTAAPAKSTGKTGTGTGKTTGGKTTGGDKTGYGQACGTNDLTWSSKSESQAGGYILVMAKAKPGITCTLSGDLPVVAFGSDGTEAANAEQSVGEPVKLSGSTVAYAGVNPKTTNTNGGKELDSIIVSASNDDPNPVSLNVGTITVDRPIVTNWHTSASQAVPGDGGTDN